MSGSSTPRSILEHVGNPIERLVRRMMTVGLIGGGSAHRPPFRGGRRHPLCAADSPGRCIGQSRERLYSPAMWDRLGSYSAYEDLTISPERIRRWHPLNQSLYAAYKVMLPGLLLAGKGDRALRTASTEGRYPFLDEKVVEFCSQIAPEYKLRGWTDKWLLRAVAERVAPKQVQTQRKVMFRANMGSAFLGPQRPAWVDQLLSPESLAATGYFDAAAVDAARAMQFANGRRIAPTLRVRHGPGGRHLHAALAPSLLRRRPVRVAAVDRRRNLPANGRACRVVA